MDKFSGIKNGPNEWSADPRYIVDLVKRIVCVSVETSTHRGGADFAGGTACIATEQGRGALVFGLRVRCAKQQNAADQGHSYICRRL